MRRIVVCGGTGFDDYKLMYSVLEKIISSCDKDVEIISGHAKGADLLGERFASERGITCKVFPADWKTYGKAAGPIRNSQMIEYAEQEDPYVVAFFNGTSSGTRDTIRKAKHKGIPCDVYIYEEPGNSVKFHLLSQEKEWAI